MKQLGIIRSIESKVKVVMSDIAIDEETSANIRKVFIEAESFSKAAKTFFAL